MNSYKNKIVGITGYKGYLGSALYYELKKLDCNVKFIKSDVSNFDELKSELKKHKFDIIFHLASSEVHYENKNIKDMLLQREINASSILYLHQAIGNLNTKVVFTSSTNIFGDVNVDIVDETTNDNPQSIWSAHKLLAENYISNLFKNFTILRLPNVYGVNNEMVENNLSLEVLTRPVVNKVILNGINKNNLQLFDNKNCLRDYIHIDDVIKALLHSGIHNDSQKYYVIGSGDKKTIGQVWNTILQQLSEISIDYKGKKLNSMQMRSYVSNYYKFNKLTTWKPRVKLQTGITDTIKNINKLCEENKNG
tara:strand:- start:368 stop:1291 length:924 start_codon:yes stop_codon:yes gene_type:complete